MRRLLPVWRLAACGAAPRGQLGTIPAGCRRARGGVRPRDWQRTTRGEQSRHEHQGLPVSSGERQCPRGKERSSGSGPAMAQPQPLARRHQRSVLHVAFNEAYNKTTQHVTTGHIRSHFRGAYESFAAPGNIFGEDPEKHQDRLFEELTEMKRFMDVRVSGGASGAAEKMVHPDPAWFVSLTPSVAESRWDAAFQRYLNGSLRSFSGVFLESTARFRVLFELQRFYGEEKTADFMGWFAVQALLPYTNWRLLNSYHQSSSVASWAQNKDFVTSAYLAYAFTLDSFLLRYTQALLSSRCQAKGGFVKLYLTAFSAPPLSPALRDVVLLAEQVARSVRRLLRRPNSPLAGDVFPPPDEVRLRAAMNIINASQDEESVMRMYNDFPDVNPLQPLRNKMKLVSFLYARQNASTTYKALDATVFDGFRINPQLTLVRTGRIASRASRWLGQSTGRHAVLGLRRTACRRRLRVQGELALPRAECQRQ
ncbi:uncharacterized protein LOC144108636 [Amblyomma americanum]